MRSCPDCQSPLEPFELNCHGCGRNLLGQEVHFQIPVADVAPARKELEEAYSSWLAQGRDALQKGKYEEATNCLREAVKRSRTLEDATSKEIVARQALAQALEKLNKLQEAADQYRIIGQESQDPEQREYWLKHSQDLVASSSSLPFDLLFQKEEFRALEADEVRYVPLYCPGCKRLLAEAEVYGIRKGLQADLHCWCGAEGCPVAKQDAKHSRALQEGRASGGGQRARAVQVASQDLPGGRRKRTAAILALCLGWVGAHKFYLGESMAGLLYVAFCPTLLPFIISIYEAIVLFEMSTVSFNMTYNIDLVLSQLEPDEQPLPKIDVFSLADSVDPSMDTLDQEPQCAPAKTES